MRLLAAVEKHHAALSRADLVALDVAGCSKVTDPPLAPTTLADYGLFAVDKVDNGRLPRMLSPFLKQSGGKPRDGKRQREGEGGGEAEGGGGGEGAGGGGGGGEGAGGGGGGGAAK